ncbi:MAG: hypothetical protein Q9165_008584 [Trypethelium subeluteriae]
MSDTIMDSGSQHSAINGTRALHGPEAAELGDINLVKGGSKTNGDANYLDNLGNAPKNLLSLLESKAQAYPNKGLVFYSQGHLKAPSLRITYPSLLSQAREKASQLHQLGIEPGSIVLLHFNSHDDNLLFFWAVTYAGCVPAMSTPFSNDLEQRRAHLVHLDSLLGQPVCLTRSKLLPEFAAQSVLKLVAVETLPPPVDANNVEQDRLASLTKQEDDLAALMLTSGSTGNAKAVCLTHGLILASVAGKSATLKTGTNTTFFNWIGADHVACLTEMHIHALSVGADQIYAQAVDIVQTPLSFLQIIKEHGVAHSFAPNFFLAALWRSLNTSEGKDFLKDLDISHLKTIVTGGEANVVETCAALAQILESHGAPRNCLRPAWGMTETSGGSIYNNLFPDHDVKQRSEFASVGACVPGMEMRITDQFGNESVNGTIGNLEVRGPVVFSRYLNNAQATADSFRDGGWFATGDQGLIDASGYLNLTGRSKEILIINGVNYTPQSIEATLESVEGTVPTFTLIFPYRVSGSDTESICTVYRPAYDPDDVESRARTNYEISSTVLLHTGIRPLVIPLDERMLQKSTLGKLSRNKIQRVFQQGGLDEYQKLNEKEMESHQALHFEPASNDTEQFILDTFLDVLGVGNVKLGVTTNLFTMGVNSIDIIKVKQRLQSRVSQEIPTITVISNPTARALTTALQELQRPHQYNPMVVLQSEGSKAPLWLIHPGVGEVLIFLALAAQFRDRPIYAIRARGFEENEEYFKDVQEAVTTYYRKIKEIQPTGPYAIAGYSFGSMIAFEIAKVLESCNDEVRFLGSFNLPPHIKFRMRQLDWTNCLLHLSYFLDFFSEDYAHTMHPILQRRPREEILQHVLDLAPQHRMEELGLDGSRLANWADLAYSLQSSAVDYEPSGTVESMDVFCAIPLASVARDMDDWMTNHLGKWADFCRTQPTFHRVNGAHYTMISPANVYTFSKTLKAALDHRMV